MAEYTIHSNNQELNWNVKGVERILQNVVNILNTFMYEVAYDRIMGRNPKNIDKPSDKMTPAIIAETYELVEEYEPRANIKDVEVIDSEEGPIIKAVISIE